MYPSEIHILSQRNIMSLLALFPSFLFFDVVVCQRVTIWYSAFDDASDLDDWETWYSEAPLEFSFFETFVSWPPQHPSLSHVRSELTFLPISTVSFSYDELQSIHMPMCPRKDPSSNTVV